MNILFKIFSKQNKSDKVNIWKDNRGVSLVELVVVMAIMAVLAGVSSFSYRMVVARSATQCAKNIQVSLDKNRTTVMGKKNGRITFFVGTDDCIYMQEEFDYSSATPTLNQSTATKIGKAEVKVTYGPDDTELTSGSAITICFSRSGSLASGSEYLPIKVSKFSKNYKITIDKLTGKVTNTAY